MPNLNCAVLLFFLACLSRFGFIFLKAFARCHPQKKETHLKHLKNSLILARLLKVYLRSGGILFESFSEAMKALPSGSLVSKLSQEILENNRLGFSFREAVLSVFGRNLHFDLFLEILLNSLQTGSSTADSLEIYIHEGEKLFLSELDAKAAQIGSKMIFPLVLFILPSLLIILFSIGLAGFFP
jgi:pilus assembly protein TadC